MAKKQRQRRSARQARSKERVEREAVTAAATPANEKAPQASKAAAKPAEKKSSGKPGFFGRIKQYFADVRTEMKRVVWPSRTELSNYTLGVVCMLIVFGVCVWLVDTGIVALLVAFSSLRG